MNLIPRKWYITASIIFSAFIASAQQTIVKTDKGYVKGEDDHGILIFKGIPYAAPPVDSMRYMPPVPHIAWADTLLTTQFGAIAAQPRGKGATGSEDCLTLNVYTPGTRRHKRPVVVWVHGGSMTSGSGSGMDGRAFAGNDDIVAVTINYRLGSLGFLYMGDIDRRYAASGNNGLLDCIAALKWIKRNIAAFGGDPGRVTIMGESAGAKLISAVLVAPAAKGLFQQYIAESGSVQCIRDTVTAKNERKRILHQLGLGDNDAAKLLTLPADSIIKAQGIVCAGLGGNSFFGPVYDGVTIKDDAYKFASTSKLPKIKALIGTNKYEAALFFGPGRQLDTTTLKSLYGADAPYVYTSYKQLLKTDTDHYDAAIKVLTQYMYQMHSYRFASTLAQNNVPVWMYRFDYDNGTKYGAMHAMELQYIWNGVSKNANAEKKQLERQMHSAWVAFIKTGNPNVPALPQWPNYNPASQQVMVFDRTSTVTPLTEVFNDLAFPSAVFVLKK